MNTDEILSKLGEIGGGIFDALGDFGLWVWYWMQQFFVWAAQCVSGWFSSLTLPMMPTILKVFSNKTANKTVFFIVICYIAVINIAAFIMYGVDKRRAVTKKRRISEKALMRICFWGGALGGLIAMQIFRHKTLKKKFTVLVPLMFILQLLLWSFVIGFLAFWAFF